MEVTEMVKRQKDRQQNNVRTLQNDYVRSSDNKAKYSMEQKVRLRRRMVVFFLGASAILVFLVSTYLSQNTRLQEKQHEKEKILAELQEVKDQQEMLNLQIAKLEDDEYIAKLARKEYFLSDEGEIIFTIPGDEENEDQKSK